MKRAYPGHKERFIKTCSGFKTCIAVVRGAGLIISRYLADTTSSTVQPFLFVSAELLTPFPPNFKVGGKESKEKRRRILGVCLSFYVSTEGRDGQEESNRR
jgi:hypothetical protein